MLTVIGATADGLGKRVARATKSRTFSGDNHGETSSLVSVEERHQAARIAIRQRSKQHAVHDREDGRRRADAERQGQNRHTGERRLASQEPPRMTHVPKKKPRVPSSPFSNGRAIFREANVQLILSM